MALPTRYRSRTPSAWDPLVDIDRATRQLAQLFEPAFRSLPELSEGPEGSFAPLADLEETEDAYIIEVELPGVKKGDIEVTSRGRRITVSGERKERERKGVLRRQTRTTGRFFHEVVLPGEINEDAIEASLDEGVLTVRLPKEQSEQQRTRRVEIS